MAKRDKRIKEIHTDRVPFSGGHYAQAVVFNDTIYVSGQLPRNPFTGEMSQGDINEQATVALENIEMILKASGSDKNKILKTTVYITDMSLWSDVNNVYKKFFGDIKPSRAVVPVNKLHHNVLIEIDAIAAI